MDFIEKLKFKKKKKQSKEDESVFKGRIGRATRYDGDYSKYEWLIAFLNTNYNSNYNLFT